MQHSGRSYPVVCVIDSVNIRRKGRGTLGELAAAYTQEIIKSLPQNAATLKKVPQRTIVESGAEKVGA